MQTYSIYDIGGRLLESNVSDDEIISKYVGPDDYVTLSTIGEVTLEYEFPLIVKREN